MSKVTFHFEALRGKGATPNKPKRFAHHMGAAEQQLWKKAVKKGRLAVHTMIIKVFISHCEGGTAWTTRFTGNILSIRRGLKGQEIAAGYFETQKLSQDTASRRAQWGEGDAGRQDALVEPAQRVLWWEVVPHPGDGTGI
jgi:hypothetical protein